MHNGNMMKVILATLVLLPVIAMMAAGCNSGGEVADNGAVPLELSSTLVPDVPLDIYIYGKEPSSTKVPLAGGYVEVESAAIWGVAAEDNFGVGARFTLKSEKQAAYFYGQIPHALDFWKKQSGDTVYLVGGDGEPANSLKNAIEENRFRVYDSSRALAAVTKLPAGDNTSPSVLAIIEPDDALLNFIENNLAQAGMAGGMNSVRTALDIANLEVVAGGLYSPGQLDLVKIAQLAEKPKRITGMQLGLMVVLKSGLPGLVLKPVATRLLEENGFTELKTGDKTVYRGMWDAGDGAVIPILVRLEGSYIYAAVAGQESYARALISGVSR